MPRRARPRKICNFAGELLEDIVHTVQAVGATHSEDQVAQDFPVVARLAGRFDGLAEALKTAGDVDHAAALFRVARSWKNGVALLGGRVGENVTVRDETDLLEIARLEARLHHVLAKHQQDPHMPAADTFQDLRQLRSGLEAEDGAHAVRVRIQVIRPQVVVCAAGAGHHVHLPDLERAREAFREVKFLIRHACGGDNRDFLRLRGLQRLCRC